MICCNPSLLPACNWATVDEVDDDGDGATGDDVNDDGDSATDDGM
jgi:hypothetical protein